MDFSIRQRVLLMRIDSVNGHVLRDIIDWRWEADGASCDLLVFDPTDGGTYPCTLERESGEDWGLDFTDVLFDGIRTCVNACQFCFMTGLVAPSVNEVAQWALEPDIVESVNSRHHNARYLIDYEMAPNVRATSSMSRLTTSGLPSATHGLWQIVSTRR